MVAVIKASGARRKRVMAWRSRKPPLTYEAIAAKLGVTRQRAYAIHHEAKTAAARKAAELDASKQRAK